MKIKLAIYFVDHYTILYFSFSWRQATPVSDIVSELPALCTMFNIH